jgi:hypothetical protein
MDVRWPLSDAREGRVEKNVVGEYLGVQVAASHQDGGIVSRRVNSETDPEVCEMVGKPRGPKP